jgi:hypothetical protein
MPSYSYDVLLRLRPHVPPDMAERAARCTNHSVPSLAAPAASVILLRNGHDGLETSLLHRHAQMLGETDRAEWSTPDKALGTERSGMIKMLPPTVSILIELADLGTWAAVISRARGREVEPVLPELMETPDGSQFSYPEAGSSETLR